jgi:DNA-directed RNA polymerase specialized sigma24 family protein
VALSAFDSFVRATAAGRFPRLDDREDLWQVLLMLTARKVADLMEKETAAKRGSGRVASLSILAEDDVGFDPATTEPNPADAAAMAEGFEEMLGLLSDEDLRRIAVWKLEGCTNEEIGTKLGKSVVTVERKLKRIRELFAALAWSHRQVGQCPRHNLELAYITRQANCSSVAASENAIGTVSSTCQFRSIYPKRTMDHP